MKTACGMEVAHLLAKGERNADHYTTARNSTQRPSHQRPQCTLQTVNNDIRPTDSDAFVCDVFDLNDDEDTNIDRVRPHHIMDVFLVISWRHFLQARSKLKPGRAVGTYGLSAEVAVPEFARNPATVVYPQRHGVGAPSLLQHVFRRTVQCCRQRGTRWTAGARCAKVYIACLRLTALDKVHRAIRSSPLWCFAQFPGRQSADTILTAKLLTEKSRMWPERPLAMIKLDVKKASDQLYGSKVAPAPEAAGVAPEVALGLMRQMTGAKVMLMVLNR